MVKACISQKCNYVDITGETYVSVIESVHCSVVCSIATPQICCPAQHVRPNS